MKSTTTRQLLCALGLSLLSAAASAYVALDPDEFIRVCVFPASSNSRDDIIAPDTCAASGGVMKLFPARYNKPFSAAYPLVTQGVLFIHGGGENPKAGYKSLLADFKGNDADTTWLVAPQFLEMNRDANDPNNVAKYTPKSDRIGYLHWAPEKVPENSFDPGRYNRGDATIYPAGVHVSAFDLIDNLITRMVKQAPNLTTITVIGHSAGARFVNRYSLGTKIDHGPIAGRTIKFRYAIVSAGRFTYLDGNRYGAPPAFNLRNLSNSNCRTTYDDYPFGLTKLPVAPHYMSQLTKAEMLSRIMGKERLYIVGEKDDHTLVPGPDKSCQSNLQGTGRLQRNQIHWHHLGTVPGATTNAQFCVVPGVGHDPLEIVAADPVDDFWHTGLINQGDCKPQ